MMNRRQLCCTWPCRARTRRGFTLIEVLLVVMIIGVASAIAFPYFVKSIHGNRLQAAARTVAQIGRYARTMAVLEQRRMTVTFHFDSSTVSMDAQAKATAPEAAATPATNAPASAQNESASGMADEPAPAPVPAGTPRLQRVLEGVHIEEVRRGEEESVREGTAAIEYRANGTCTAYEVKLGDAQGNRLTIKVDTLSGVQIEK